MTDTTQLDPENTQNLLLQLREKLLALGDEIDQRPAAEIERTAKAITALIASLEKANLYLASQTHTGASAAMSKPSRLELLRKIKRMVDNGVLDELTDDPHG